MSLFKTLADDQHNEYAMIDHRQGAPAPARAPQKGEYDQPIGRSRGGLDKNPRDRRRCLALALSVNVGNAHDITHPEPLAA